MNMKKINQLLLSVATVLAMAACNSDDNWYNEKWTDTTSTTASDDDNTQTTTTVNDVVNGVSTTGDVTTFTLAFNKNAIAESYKADANDDDYLENTTIERTITVTFSTTADATVEGDDEGIVSVSGNDVIATNTTGEVIRYVLTGTTTDGFFKLYSTKKQAIVLNGVNITNPDGAAINNQSKKRTFIVLNDGTKNYLTDGTNYSDATGDEDMKACFFSEGQLIFSGAGYLEVDANCKAGIRSDDYVRTLPKTNIFVDASSGNGIRGNDAVIVSGGVININITGTADKGISTDGEVRIDGGRTTILTSGGYEYDSDEGDYTACSGIKADSLVTINGGELNIKSTGTGGKGINSDDQIVINDGVVRIITTGKRQKDSKGSVSPKGIKADGNITINGGQTQVRLEGSGDGTEAIESKAEIHIEAGTVECYRGVLQLRRCHQLGRQPLYRRRLRLCPCYEQRRNRRQQEPLHQRRRSHRRGRSAAGVWHRRSRGILSIHQRRHGDCRWRRHAGHIFFIQTGQHRRQRITGHNPWRARRHHHHPRLHHARQQQRHIADDLLARVQVRLHLHPACRLRSRRRHLVLRPHHGLHHRQRHPECRRYRLHLR